MSLHGAGVDNVTLFVDHGFNQNRSVDVCRFCKSRVSRGRREQLSRRLNLTTNPQDFSFFILPPSVPRAQARSAVPCR